LLHSISELNGEIPNNGQKIFKDIGKQTAALLVMSDGAQRRDMFGNMNGVPGLRMISRLFLNRIRTGEHNEDHSPKFLDINGYHALYAKDKNNLDKINDILKYVWIYVFYHKQKMKKERIKPPKYLFRGIRISNLYSEKDIEEVIRKIQFTETDSWVTKTEKRIDMVIDYILNNGIDKIIPGKFLSFTASENIADYFAHGEGFILRVESKKVDIITSELTEPLLAEKDYVSNKKEKEYIVKIPSGYKFTQDDIMITHLDWFIAKNNPLCVQYFDHSNKGAEYTMNGKKIYAAYYWHTNERGSVEFRLNENRDDWYMLSRKEFKEQNGFDPMPSQKNLSQIKDFKFIDIKK
jgi:hypothetical protein